ncbi:protein phosphatase 2C domain-containing protein [Fredinandcohnia humi]
MSITIQQYSCSSPSKHESEDALFLNHETQMYGVMDGSTPLIPFTDENGHNGAYLASHLFKNYFEQLMKEDGVSLFSAVVDANERLRNEMEKQKVDIEQKHHLWCTCIAAIQIHETFVEFVQLGDCMAVAGYQDGSVEVLTKDTVKNISFRAKEKRNRDRENGMDVPNEEIFKDIRNDLHYNRSMANTREGYTVANGMPEVKNFIQHGKIELSRLSSLLLVTDGLFFPGQALDVSFRYIQENGLESYAKELKKIQEEKGGKIDDKAGLFLVFK